MQKSFTIVIDNNEKDKIELPLFNKESCNFLIENVVEDGNIQVGFLSDFLVAIRNDKISHEKHGFYEFKFQLINSEIYRYDIEREKKSGNVRLDVPTVDAVGSRGEEMIYLLDHPKSLAVIEFEEDCFLLFERKGSFEEKFPVVYRDFKSGKVNYEIMDSPFSSHIISGKMPRFLNTSKIYNLATITGSEISAIPGMTEIGAKTFRDVSLLSSEIIKTLENRIEIAVSDMDKLFVKIKDYAKNGKVENCVDEHDASLTIRQINTLVYDKNMWTELHNKRTM